MSRTTLRGLQVTDSSINAIDTDDTIEKTANKGIASGYVGLDETVKVSTINLGDGIANDTNFLRGDRTWSFLKFSLTLFELDDINNIRHKEDIVGAGGIFELNINGDIQPTISNTIDELFETISGNIILKE